MKKRGSGLSFYLILIAVILLSSFWMTRYRNPDAVNLSQVYQDIENGKVKSLVLRGYDLQVTLKPQGKEQQPLTISKQINPMMIEDLTKKLQKAVDDKKLESFDYVQPPDYSSMLNMILLVVMMGGMAFAMWYSFTHQSGDTRSAMSFGRSRARKSDPDKNEVTFDDVAGAEEEKHELAEVVDFLKDPDKYTRLGAKIPRGILLVGPPGTGKTLLAKAVAGEAGTPFFSISGSDFVEMFVGVGASRVRDLFQEAKKQTPCIIFIDEIDAVGRRRGAGLGGGHDEREQTLNQLLVEMDGFGPNEGVIVMAATNRVDILDPALLRPGRFDRRINVMRPDLNGRFEILKVHARKKPLAPNVDLKEIAKITPGFTGADLANLLNEAALLAARRNAEQITYSDISEAVFKVTVGPEKKSRIVSPKERALTAYHESGHAIVLRAVSRNQRVERVTIIPANEAGGYTAYKPNEDLFFETREDLFHSIMVALGGRAAEELTQDAVSTGAYSDLQHCNKLARAMVTRYGMSRKLGNFVYQEDDEVFLGRDYGHASKYSERTAAMVDEEVREILAEAYEATLQVLRDNREMLEQLSKRLLEVDKIEGPEFEELYKKYAANWEPAPGAEENKTFITELGQDDAATAEPAEQQGEAPEAVPQPEQAGDKAEQLNAAGDEPLQPIPPKSEEK